MIEITRYRCYSVRFPGDINHRSNPSVAIAVNPSSFALGRRRSSRGCPAGVSRLRRQFPGRSPLGRLALPGPGRLGGRVVASYLYKYELMIVFKD
jgi:hypothetical protein